MYCKLLRKLTDDTLVLTVNSRLASYLQQQYDQQQSPKSAWPTPNIVPLNHWLQTCWQEQLIFPSQLLNALAERQLWNKVLRQSAAADLLLHVEDTARLAQQAWQTLQLWNTSWQALRSELSEEVQTFIRWAQQFEQQLTEHQWITQSQLHRRIAELITHQQLALPQQIIVTGFDERSPAVTQLMQCLQQHTQLSEFTHQYPNAIVQRVATTDTTTEILTAARWAKQLLTVQGDHRIGIIVPNLQQNRRHITEQLTQVFKPNHDLAGQASTTYPFNLSGGDNLAAYGLIRVAMSALQLLSQTQVNPAALQQVMLSPYINSSLEDQCIAAELENQLNTQLPSIYTKAQLLNHLVHHCTLDQTEPAQRLCALLQYPINHTRQAITAWTRFIEQALKQLGWPGQQPLSSQDYQLAQRWQQVLSELDQLNTLIGPLTLTEAWQLLRDTCRQTMFQPQTPSAPIQVLGLLEAAGNEFTALWITGMDDDTWPAKAKPNPFLPIHMQRQLQMPHASAQRELAYSEKIQARLLQSAPTVIISHAQQQDDQALRASRLTQSLPLHDMNELTLASYQDNADQERQRYECEYLVDEQAPTVNSQETIRRGSQLLKQQALCPFKAFASERLQAQYPQPASLGLSALDKGSLVHYILETLWQKLGCQAQLKQLSDNQLEALIQQHIEQHMWRLSTHPEHCITVEKQRLERLLKRWLTFEKQRPPFTVIAQESQCQITWNQFTFNLKIDRIDQLENGKQLIIDYKTGKQLSPQPWFAERPSEPQLPLYCLAAEDDVIGLSYAQVNEQEIQFCGVIDDQYSEAKFAKLKPLTTLTEQTNHWQHQLKAWRLRLEALLNEFLQGYAAVMPSNTQACQQCDLQALCRIGSHT